MRTILPLAKPLREPGCLLTCGWTEFEVDQNRSGVEWRYRIRRNGRTVARGTRVTRPPTAPSRWSRITDPAGRDRISAVAVRGDGETCRASLRI